MFEAAIRVKINASDKIIFENQKKGENMEIKDIASEEVVLQLVMSKCIPSFLYGFEACTGTKSELSSLDFTVNRFTRCASTLNVITCINVLLFRFLLINYVLLHDRPVWYTVNV